MGVLHKFVCDLSLKKAFLYNPDQYLSPEEYSGLDFSTGLLMLPQNMVILKPRGLETLSWLYQILLYQAFSGVDFLAPRKLRDLVYVIQSNMVFFNPRGWWNPLYDFFNILAVPGLLLCELPRSVGVGALCKNVCGIWFLKRVLLQHWSVIGHQSNTLALTIHQVSRFLLIWYFSILEVKRFFSLSYFGCTKPCPVWISSQFQSWASCTKVCGIDVWKMWVRITLILYLSLDESF